MINGLATDSFNIRYARLRYIALRVYHRLLLGKEKRNAMFAEKQIEFYKFVPPGIYKREGFRALVRKGTDDFIQLFTLREDPVKGFISLEHNPSGLFVDVGSNVGYYVLSLATKYPKCKILAVEAHPETCKALQYNISLNKHLGDRVMVKNIAVANYTGKMKLYERILSDNSIISSHSSLLFDFGTSAVEVNCDTLNNMLKDYQVIDLMKIDIEGAEVIALEQAKDILPTVRKIIVEIHVDNLGKVLDQLKPYFNKIEIVPFGQQHYVVGDKLE